MTSTARVQIDRFRRIDETEYLSIMAQPTPPRTVDRIEAEILSHHGIIIAHEGQIRDAWKIRRQRQKIDGLGTAWVRTMSRIVREQARCIRYRRKKIAALNAEVDQLERSAPQM